MQKEGKMKKSAHHRNRRILLTAVLGTALASVMASPALGTEKGERTLTHETVLVTADRAREEMGQITQNVSVITEEEIARSSADNVVELLKKQGIQTTADGSASYGNEGVVMRGGSTSMHGFDLAGDVLMLVDGRRMGTDFASVMGLDNVARVEIIRGPGAVQYGSAAIGGVINIITKRGAEKPEASLEAGWGSFGKQRYKAFGAGQIGQWDMAGWASWAKDNDYDDGDGNEWANSALGGQAKFGFNVGYNFLEKHRIGLSFSGMDGRDMGGGPETDSKGTSWGVQRQDRNYYMGELLYEGASADDTWSWSARYWHGRTSYDISRESLKTSSLGQRELYSTNENIINGGQAQVTFAGNKYFKLIGGVDALRYDMEQSQPKSLFTDADKASYTTSDYLNIGAFLIGKLYLLNEKLTLSASGRYDYFKTNVDGIMGNTTNKADRKVNNFSPAVGIAYTPWDFLKLRANYGEAFKMPTPRQLGGVFSMMGTFVGDPNLKPEKTKTWDVGFDVNYKGLNGSFTYFQTRYDDMIGYYLDDQDYRKYFNIAKAEITGMELMLSFDLGQAFSWPFSLEPYFSYTRLFTYKGTNYNYRTKKLVPYHTLPDIAQTSASYGILFNHPGWGLSSSLDVTYFGSCLEMSSPSSKNPVYSYSPYPDNSATVVDFNLKKRLWQFENGSEFNIKFAVKNLFDAYYASKTFYMPGRNFYVGIQYKY